MFKGSRSLVGEQFKSLRVSPKERNIVVVHWVLGMADQIGMDSCYVICININYLLDSFLARLICLKDVHSVLSYQLQNDDIYARKTIYIFGFDDNIYTVTTMYVAN